MCGHGGTALSKYLLTGIKGENDISWCNFRGKSSSVKTLRLFFSSDGVVFGFGERSRSNENSWKFLKIRRVSGIISFTEVERKESIRFHFLPVFLMTQTPMNLFKVCNELNGVQFSFHRSQATELQAGSVLCFRIPLVWFSPDRVALRFRQRLPLQLRR